MPIEIITALLVAVLGIATLVAAFIGIASLTGTMVIQRCPRCRHMRIPSASRPEEGCGYCRHDRLLHPLWALHRSRTAYWASHRP